jgi:hypothetical protein
MWDFLADWLKWSVGVVICTVVGGVLIWYIAFQVFNAYFVAKERFIRRFGHGWQSEKQTESEKREEGKR